MSVRFAASPIAWSNDDMPALGADTSLQACLKDISELGFEGVELGSKFPREAGALAAVLRSFDLNLAGGWFSGSLLRGGADAEIARMQGHLGLLEAQGVDVFIYCDISGAVHANASRPLSDSPALEEDDWRRFGDGLNQVSEYLLSRGFRMAYHHHAGTVIETSAELARLFTVTDDHVGITLDTGHAALANIDPLEIIAMAPKRIAHIHCKDLRSDIAARVRFKNWSFLEGVVQGVFTSPGDGVLDFAALMRALAEAGYSGWLVVEAEQDPSKADPRTYTQFGLDYLKKQAAAAGLI